MKSFTERLAARLRAAEEAGAFSAVRFFQLWFREDGTPYVFVFKKNLRVTNMQYAELRALLRTHLKGVNGEPGDPAVQLFSRDEFVSALDALVSAFPQEKEPLLRYRRIAEMYAPLISRMVVLEAHFGSCIAYLPHHLAVDIGRVCTLAGYIHACGRLVFVRRVEKATRDEFFAALRLYLDRYKEGHRRRFVVYCHEDYTAFDRHAASLLRDGLDDLKIHLEKYFMGDRHLVSVVARMRDEFGRELTIPLPGDYHQHAREKDETGLQMSTIWLFCDRGIAFEWKTPSDDAFFVAYEQLFCNRNAFQISDENKPAWVAHTTMPHALAAAMVNITRTGWQAGDGVRVSDPFVGTGTILLECLKDPRIQPICSDVAPIAPLLVRDNARFFSMGSESLLALAGHLKCQVGPNASGGGPERPKWLLELCAELPEAGADPGALISGEVVDKLEAMTYAERLQFYLGLRALRRHTVAIARGVYTIDRAFAEEVRRFCAELHEVAALRESAGPCDVVPVAEVHTRYSTGCFVTVPHEEQWPEVKVMSVLDLPAGKFDVIVGDPPYGFNTNNGLTELARLYVGAIDAMVRALAPGGQLVLCLPQWSRTGRRVPYFTQREVIVQQVLVAASRQGREPLASAFSAPRLGGLFRPPYYWESERALRRSIVHFQFA